MKTTCPFPPMTRAEYDAVDAVNWSTLKYALTSGLHYRHCIAQATEETDAMRLGRAIHAMVFEPDTFDDEFAVWEGGRRAGGEWSQFKDTHLTQTIIRGEDLQAALDIAEAVNRHPVAGPILANGAAEVSITLTDPQTGIACKGRMDWLTDTVLVDLKSTKSIDARAFGVHAAAMLYHCQLAFYAGGLSANGAERDAKIIAVESSPPYDVAVFSLTDDDLWAGEVRVQQALETVQKCRKTRTWPGQYQEEVPLALPGYVFPSDDEVDAWLKEGV